MKRKLLPLAALFISGVTYSQVGVGTLTPNKSAQIEIVSSNRGMLIPRVALQSPADVTTISAGNVESLLVYNTTANTLITPGYYYWFDKKWVRLVSNADASNLNNTTNVMLSVVGKDLVLRDSDGNIVSVPLADINASDIVTTLINNGGATYTYTSEDGTKTVIDVPADVINNFEEIIQDNTVLEQLIKYLTNTYIGGNVYYDGNKFSYVDIHGVKHDITFADIVQMNETLTILAFNQATGILTYQDEKKNITSIDIKSAIDSFETITTLTADYNAGTITYLNEANNPVTVDIKAMVAAGAETITTLINNGKGKYTYTSEDGTKTVIDVPADVINNFEEIIQNTTVLEQLITYLTNTYVGGNVYYDGTQFTYVDKQGNVHVINFADIVQMNETLTILAFNQATGILTYQDEKKNITALDIKTAIVNFETITTLTPDYNAGTITYLNEAGNSVTVDIKAMVAAGAETITTLINNGDGTYTYTSENGTITKIDIPADVINNFEEIIQNTTVLEQLITYLTNTYVGGNVYYDGTQFTYVDKQGNVHVINFADIVQMNETLTILAFNQATGILTYQDEKKNITALDIKTAIVNFETITTLTPDYNAGTITYLNEAGNSVTVDIKAMVAAGAETITTLINNGDGTYTYTSENGTITKIDIPADVINNFEEIIQNTTVLEQLITYLTNTYVGGNVYYDGTQFTYVDKQGNTHIINFADIVQANETLTILAYNQATGILTYSDEKKNITALDIKGAISNFETITTLTPDYNAGTITYLNEAGTSVTVNIKAMVAAGAETITTLINNGDGTYTYTSENGTITKIDIPADVINNFEEIIQNTTVLEQLITYLTNTYVGGNVYYDGTQFTYVDKQGNTHIINFADIVQANETLTILAYNQATGILTYSDEKKNITSLDIKGAISNFETITTLTPNYAAGTMTYLNEAGTSVTVDIKAMVAAGAETITTLVNNGKGKYTYTSEDKTVTVIDVPADVINNFEEIIQNTTVLEQLITYLTNTYVGGNVYYDGTQFTYVDKQGNTHIINFADIVQANETLTILAYNQATGILTYSDEKKNITSLDIKGAISNFETITTLTPNYAAGTMTYLNEAGTSVTVDIKAMVAAGAETITTLVNNGKGKYTYTSEDKTVTVIDVPADVINNFEEIIQNTTVLEQLITYLTNTYVGGNVYYDGTQFTYVDKQGNTHIINFADIVQANETLTILAYNQATGILTYSDEKKNITSLDIKGAISNFETITTLTPNYAAGTMTYLNEAGTSVTVDIKAMVAAGAETITTLINNGKGKYTYTSEDKTVTVIDVPADVINNFEEIIKNKTVLEQLITYLTNTYVGGNVYYDGTKFTYVDKQGNVHNITFEDIVQANETLTILAFNQATGILTYQDEKKNITSIDIKSAIDSFETITTLTADYTAGTITYLNEASNPVTVDIKAMVAAGAETITTLINNGKGKYTYTSEDKTVTVIDVPEDVINNFEEIIKNKTVLEQLITYLTNTYVGGNVYYDGTQFTYVDKQGNVHNITFEDIVQANETLTILAFNQATGILTYQDEKKNITSIDIKSAIDSFETITTLTADYTAGTITYLNEASNPVTVDIKAMVAAGAETITTLINNGKGKYTYTSEDKTVTVIDVPADVINNFEEIIKNKTVLEQLITYLTNTYVGGNVYYDGTQFTYVDKQGNVHNIIFEDIVQANETLTILAFNQATGILTYQDEKKNITSIDIKSAIDSFETITTLTADYNAGTITYLNEASNPVTVDIKSMVAAGAETITTLTKGANGTYVYKSENGTLTTIDVPADVISNFTQIIQDPTVLQKLILNLTGTYVGGNVYYDGTKFTYVDQAGAVHNINLEQIVQANETLTILGYTPATGILTYQDEKKNVTSVDIKAAVKSFETLTSLSANAANGTITFKDEAGNSTTINIKDLVGMSETITTFVKNGNGTYTYKNEADVTTTIDPSMVNVTYANGIYTFKDNLGNNLTEINTNASNIIYNNNTSGLTAVNVQNAIDELVLKLNNVPTTKGSITGTGITVTNGNNATLRDVQVAITPGAAGQVLVTNASATATEWIDKANFIPTISNTLTKEGTNTLVSTVNGVVAKANLVESVVNAITGSSLVTTVNGVASTALDLTNAIQAGQKTVTVVDGENTTVSSSTGNNNTEYKVNVSKAAIQAAQKTTVVAAGTGVTVTPDTNGDITTYTVATSGTTAVTLAGDVTGPTTNTKVERIQTVPVSAIAPRNNEVLTFDGTNWKPALPTVDAGTITNGKAFTSTDLDLQGDPSTSLLKAVSANIKTGAVTSEKILDGTIRPIDMNSEGNNLVLTTDASGRPTWINKADLNQANQKTSSVTSTTADLVVTPKVGGDNTNYELTLKSAMPKFFYMPAVIFDTNTNGVRTKNLYAEYTAQFGLGGGMIASAGSSGSIPVLGSSELEFYVTYYDPAVFSNLSITADGILTYTVIGKATRASYMNIVFVVK